MIQIRAGDFVAVRNNDGFVLFAVLTKQILFGGHWCFVCHNSVSRLPQSIFGARNSGFNAFVDFIVPKREKRLERISRNNDFSHLKGPELLNQVPLKDEVNYRIWRWKNSERLDVEYVRFTASPTRAERAAPYYGCLPADFACSLAMREWQSGQSMWAA
jgi:hypothetical protein